MDIEAALAATRHVGTIEREQAKGSITVGADGGEFSDVTVDSEIVDNDWSRIFRIFKLNPDEFEVVDDTVKISTWQQSKRLEDGHRDTVQLWSYSGRFRRKPKGRLSDADLAEHRAAIRRWKPNRSSTVKRRHDTGIPVTPTINLADIQGGKSEGGGVAATSKRLTDGLENVERWLDRLSHDHNLEGVLLANNGDPFEGCAGNYDSQLFTVELNLRGQMNFVLDHWTVYAKRLFPRFGKAEFVSVLCNHTELGRMGAKRNQTSDSDSGGAFLAEALQRILEGRPEFEHVTWTIPHDQMNVYTTVSGVPMAFNHGHKIPGNADASSFEKWLNGQVRGDSQAHAARIWQTAHKHHFAAWDMGSTSVFQAPSLDGGSKWLRDMTGRYARSGILAYVVGEHHPLGWSDLAFL